MRKVQRWRYYCEFCKKVGGSAGHMATHESACTGNPNRVCRMCRRLELSQQPTEALIAALRSEGIAALRKLAEECPPCILSAIRLSGMQSQPDEEGPGTWIDYEFKAEMAKAHARANEIKQVKMHEASYHAY